MGDSTEAGDFGGPKAFLYVSSIILLPNTGPVCKKNFS